MSWFFFYQKVGGEEAWSTALAEYRDKTVADIQPQFTTILDVDNSFAEELEAEQLARLHYRGDLYFDFDSSDIEEAIDQFKKFLGKLEGLGVNPGMLKLYATGGKGFHCIMPHQMYMSKMPPKGVPGLPAIYKEMAASEELFVDTLDLRVYTARRGRMFRQANVERLGKDGKPNGRYKVPITAVEAQSLQVEQYHKLVSAPRHIAAAVPPELNTTLALMYQTAHDKVEAALKKPKQSKADAQMIARFKGEVPPTLAAIMQGENLADGVGFQKIATQLALAMHALAVSEERMLTLCEGLVQHHRSDGERYNSPAKRRAELSRMYRYMQDNASYTFSVGGVKSLVRRDVDTPDFDSGGIEIEDEEQYDDGIDPSLLQGLRINTSGIYRNTEHGHQKICAMGLAAPKMLLDINTCEVVGYEVDIYLGGKKKATRVVDMSTFSSRAKFQAFSLSSAGVSMNANDMQVGAVADILRARAEQAGQVIYTVSAEGLDVIKRPDAQLDVVWVDDAGVRSASGTQYKFVGGFTSDPEYRSDVARAPVLADTPEAREFFQNLFEINRPDLVGKMFGWYTACYFSQLIRHKFGQFPMLQVIGQAGAGKSKTSELFMWMHYFEQTPRMQSATSLTPFAIDALSSSSASIPFYIDEYKPRQMDKARVDKLENIMRDNYTGLAMGKGRVTGRTGESKLHLKGLRNSAPLTVLSEAAVLQTAVAERTVYVPFSKATMRGRFEHFNFCYARHEYMSMFGRLCLEKALGVKTKALAKMIEDNREAVRQVVPPEVADAYRPIFNLAVVLTGLDIAQLLLKSVFGSIFTEQFDKVRASLLTGADVILPTQRTELAKVFDDLAALSQIKEIYDTHSLRLIEGEDYLTYDDCIHFKMRACWDKYVRYKRQLGAEILYDSLDAFLHACINSDGMADRYSIKSPLKETPMMTVYTISKPWLMREKVAEFRS